MSSQRIGRNFLYLSLSQGIAVLSSVLLLAYLARALTPVNFGIYGLVSAAVAMLVPLPFAGMTRVFEREASRHQASLPALLSTTLALRVGFSLAVLLLMGLVGTVIGGGAYRPLVLAAGAWLVLGSLCGAFSELYVALERTEFEAATNLIYKTALVMLAVIFVEMGLGVYGVFLGKAFARGVQLVIMATHAHLRLAVLSHLPQVKLARMFLREGFPLGVSEVLQMGFFKVDEVLLGLLAPLRQVGIFHGPYQVILGISLLPQQFMRSAFPTYSRVALNGHGRSEEVYQRSLRVLAWIAFPVAVGLFLYAPLAATLLMGSQYPEATTALRLLSLSVPFMFLEVFLRYTLTSRNLQRFDAMATGLAVGVNIAVDLALIPWLGFVGACIGTLVAVIGYCAAGCVRLGRELPEFRLPRDVILIGGLAGVVTVGHLVLPDFERWVLGGAMLAVVGIFVYLQRDALEIVFDKPTLPFRGSSSSPQSQREFAEERSP